VRPELSSPRSPLHFAPPPASFGARSGRRPSSGECAAVPSIRADVGPQWTGHAQPVHRDVDPVHGINRWKIIHYSDYSEILQRGPWTFVKLTRGPDFTDFALRPLGFSEINPRSTIFAVRSKIQKIFTKRSLAYNLICILYALLCGQKFYSCKKWVLQFQTNLNSIQI
jgi:hypothetical protein